MIGEANQNISYGATAASAALSVGASAGWIAAAAVPIVGAAIAGVAITLSAIVNRRTPRQKVWTTQIVDEIEPLLAANRDAYLNGNRYAAAQAAALENFDSAWRHLVATAGTPEMGNPGKAAVRDRQRGGKHDWFQLYRDPISQTPARPNPTLDAQITASLSDLAAQSSLFRLAAPAALALLALWMVAR